LTDLQFSEPPAGGVLAKDEDELGVFQIQLLRAGRGAGSDHLGDLCTEKTENVKRKKKKFSCDKKRE